MSKKTVTLSSGFEMPLLGLGCWQSLEGEVETAVEAALDAGYRHIDTAYNYLNEEAVGTGIHNWLKKTGQNRSELFIVTKLPMIGMNAGGVEKFLKKSLSMLKLDYVDLFLVHFPMGMKGKNDTDVFPMTEDGKMHMDFGSDLIAVWKDMEKMVDLGLTKSIGISNYSIKQMRKMLAIARIPPAVNQLEVHVYCQKKEMQEFCKTHNIAITAYSPLGSPGRPSSFGGASLPVPAKLMEDPVVCLVAEGHHVTPAQVLLRFLVQQNLMTIPKSVNPKRIVANFDVWDFALTDLEMAALKSLDKGKAGSFFARGALPGMDEHPDYDPTF